MTSENNALGLVEKRFRSPAFYVAAAATFVGTLAQNFTALPQVVRYHTGDLGAGYLGATCVDVLQIALSDKFGFKAKARPLICATVVLAAATGFEAIEASDRNAPFDIDDEICHVFSAAAYAAHGVARRRQEQKAAQAGQQTPEAAPSAELVA